MQSTYMPLLGALASDGPIAQRMLEARTRSHLDAFASEVVQAVLAALSGDAREAEATLRRARAAGVPEQELLLETARAFVFVETGAAARAAAPLGRARKALDKCTDPSARPFLLLLQAQFLLAKRGAAAARPIVADAQRLLPAGDEHADLRAYASLVQTSLELEAGEPDAAERELSTGSTARSGILAGRADLLRARLRFRRTVDARASAVDLASAINRFTMIGAARDLGLACLERALQVGSDPAGSPGYWLARAKSLLATSGSATDLHALRRACRALEGHGSRPSELAGDASRVGQLSAATQELASLEDDELLSAIPRLALGLCAATGAHLVRVREGAGEVLATSGAEISLRDEALAGRIREALSSRAPSGADSISAVPVGRPEEGLALVVEQASPVPGIAEADLEQLAVFASFAGASLARARARAEAPDAAAAPSRVQTIAKRRGGPAARFTFDHLIGQDPAFLEVIEAARRAAAFDLPILITGESGTGKELLAQAIHNASPREAAPFVGVNVTALPRELVESELFGYEPGTFTGARSGGMAGKFELAGRGTVLLDEIGDVPLEIQSKLLRVLQEKVVHRLGSVADVPVPARVIAATHRDLAQAVDRREFRLDLYHRLRVIHLRIPPLRERKGDILRIAQHQLRLYAEESGRRPIRLSPEVAAAFEAYDWPGNVRELCNVVESEAALLAPGEDVISEIPQVIQEGSLRPTERGSGNPVVPLEELERWACENALQHFSGNVARAARALGVAKTTLYTKMKKYGLGTFGVAADAAGA